MELPPEAYELASYFESTYIGRHIPNNEVILSNNCTTNQFEICPSHIISIRDILFRVITQTEAMKIASLSIKSCTDCRCKNCKTNMNQDKMEDRVETATTAIATISLLLLNLEKY